MLVDVNGDNSAEYNLVFDPRYQSQPFVATNLPDQGKTQVGVWQTWDAFHGGWFIGPNINDDPDHGGAFFTLATFILQHPNARIMNDLAKGGPAIRVTVGGPVFSKGFKGDVDNFRIGVNGVTTIFDFEFTTANAGADKNVIYGYGSNCTHLNGTAAGGVAPYTYHWKSGISTTHNASLEVCPTETTTYTLQVTDANGCSRTDDVTVFVNDVRCGNKLSNVEVCHNGQAICIATAAVQAHLNHGDELGACEAKLTTTRAQHLLTEGTNKLKVFNYPNPSSTSTTIRYELPIDGKVGITMYDATGKQIAIIENRFRKAGLHNVECMVGNLKTGYYYYTIVVASANSILTKTKKMAIMQGAKN